MQVPSTAVPLTLEQQHITAVEGIVPTLQGTVVTVNLDCRLDLKTITLHARNAKYSPKVGTMTGDDGGTRGATNHPRDIVRCLLGI